MYCTRARQDYLNQLAVADMPGKVLFICLVHLGKIRAGLQRFVVEIMFEFVCTHVTQISKDGSLDNFGTHMECQHQLNNIKSNISLIAP